jgi:hypothetical protein
MGLRFSRSIRIAPGVRLNLSRSGLSLSVGARGASVNVGRRGVRTTVGMPGTGLSYSETVSRERGCASVVLGLVLVGVVLAGLLAVAAMLLGLAG